jgi:hypothetical protein
LRLASGSGKESMMRQRQHCRKNPDPRLPLREKVGVRVILNDETGC